MYLPVYVAITVPGLAAPRRKPEVFWTEPVPVPEPPVGKVETLDLVFRECWFFSACGVFLSEGIFLAAPLIESSLFYFWFWSSVTGEADLMRALAVASYYPFTLVFLDLLTGDSGLLPTEAAVVDEGLSSSSNPPFCMGFDDPGLWGILHDIMGLPESLWKDLVWAESVDLCCSTRSWRSILSTAAPVALIGPPALKVCCENWPCLSDLSPIFVLELLTYEVLITPILNGPYFDEFKPPLAIAPKLWFLPKFIWFYLK